MSWTRWILFLLLFVFVIWVFYLWQRQDKIQNDWKTKLPVSRHIVYSPYRLPYRYYIWDEALSVSECISLSVNGSTTEDSFYTPVGKSAKSLHELAKKLTKTPYSHHQIQIHRVVEGGSEFGYDVDPETETKMATIVIYLNEGYQGGELTFSAFNETIIPKRGRMVFYWTVDGQNVITESRHRHRYIIGGIQWKAVIYIHSVPI